MDQTKNDFDNQPKTDKWFLLRFKLSQQIVYIHAWSPLTMKGRYMHSIYGPFFTAARELEKATLTISEQV